MNTTFVSFNFCTEIRKHKSSGNGPLIAVPKILMLTSQKQRSHRRKRGHSPQTANMILPGYISLMKFMSLEPIEVVIASSFSQRSGLYVTSQLKC